MEDLQPSSSFSKEFENILSNDLDENSIKEIDKMTELLETYTQHVNATNERLERILDKQPKMEELALIMDQFTRKLKRT